MYQALDQKGATLVSCKQEKAQDRDQDNNEMQKDFEQAGTSPNLDSQDEQSYGNSKFDCFTNEENCNHIEPSQDDNDEH